MKTLYKFIRAGVVSALFVQVGFAQKDNVGIGTTKPDQSAILDLSSTNKGLLMPRVTLQQRNSIQNPANGLIVYQTDLLSGFYYYDGKEWKNIGSETSQKSVADAFNWGLTGNAGTNSGNFLGTTDAQPLRFKVNNTNYGGLTPTGSSNGSVYLGFLSGDNISSIGTNVGIGAYAITGVLPSPNNGSNGVNNVAIGNGTLYANRNGSDNLALGNSALISNSDGSNNVSMGSNSLRTNTTGSGNIALGRLSLFTNGTGSDNVAIGTNAGYSAAGSSNIFIGQSAGYSEAGSSTLYIANSSTTTPLIYGDFATKYLAVGEVAASDRAAATSGGYRLLVKGGMITEKIKVATAGTADWADYVFEEGYKVMPLEEVEAYITENKHLPNVPTTAEMIINGNDLQKTDAKLLEKIEELTLYLIEMNKEIKSLKAENTKLKLRDK